MNKNVIFDFRSKDLSLGGQGAPIAPIYHQFIMERSNLELPSCFLNIGGVSNLTYWDGELLIGFDTGPGNALMDDCMSSMLSQNYDIVEEDGDKIGKQYPTDTGPIDILAISKDKKEVLVVELKKGRASDSVVGQIQRYMGYVTEFVAEDNQQVKGVIIALDEDQRIKFALKVAPNIEFYRYEVKFDLIKE